MEKNAAIQIQHISKTYNMYMKQFDRFREAVSIRRKSYHNDFQALEDINLTVYQGECVGIIGTNGAGKSTLLKIITGVLNPTSGSVHIEGHVSSLLELGAGFNRDYTGLENIYLNGKIMGYSEEEIKQRVPLIEQFAGIGEFINQPVKNYSSGMFARLAFAVAINVDPDVLIVDEALSVGDVFFQTKCYHKFDEFRKQGKTILFVSHDLGSVIKYCDRCLLLHKGKQIMAGPCKEVVDKYRKIMVEHPVNDSLPQTSPEDQETNNSSEDQHFRWPAGQIWKNKMNQNPECQEYGDRRGEILDYGLMNEQGEVTSMIMKGEAFTVLYRFKIHEQIDHPIFAFTIRDLKGTELCGTNTLYEDKIIETAEAGLTGVVTFKQRMMLQGGQYLLSLGLTGYIDGELNAYHRLYDVCHIEVLSDLNTVGFFDPESDVEYADVHVEGELKK